MRLSDSIERFIKEMMEQEETEVELKRNELAEYFGCAPSQINYVLATRFSPDHGYVTESRRGGGGYIRIVRVRASAQDRLRYLLSDRIGESIDEGSALRLIAGLCETGFISAEDGRLMAAALSSRALSLPVPEQMKDALRARIFRSMLLEISQRNDDHMEAPTL